MSTDPNPNETSAIVEVEPKTDAIVKTEAPKDDIKAETQALIDAIRMRAQAEIHTAQDLTRDAYLNAVKQARMAIEQNKLIDPDRIEEAIQHIQQDAEKNWNTMMHEMQSLGDRISEAAKAAWDTLIHPPGDAGQGRDRNE